MEVAEVYVFYSGTECSTTIDTAFNIVEHSAAKSFTEFGGVTA